jgi:predicted RNase H-like HicB family nuclease
VGVYISPKNAKEILELWIQKITNQENPPPSALFVLTKKGGI